MKSIRVTLASSTASRIGQLVRLLGSDRPGEVVAAATAINRTLVSAGTDIHHLGDVVDRGLQQVSQLARAPAGNGNVATIIKFCAFPGNQLNQREQDFIRKLHHLVLQRGDNFQPSEKQLAWLLGIHRRLTQR